MVVDDERWEPTDRPATSYLVLDDEGVFYSGHSDGYVYLRETGEADNGTNMGLDSGGGVRCGGSWKRDYGDSYTGTKGETPDTAKEPPTNYRASSRPYQALAHSLT